jgi:hypothetical protein
VRKYTQIYTQEEILERNKISLKHLQSLKNFFLNAERNDIALYLEGPKHKSGRKRRLDEIETSYYKNLVKSNNTLTLHRLSINFAP